MLTLILVSSYCFSQTVQYYGFSQSQGTYTELDNPDMLAEATSTNGLWNNSYDVNLPFQFSFNGNSYSTLKVHSYGFITFGTDAPYGYVPISSSNIGYQGYEGAIAPFAGSITAYNFSDTDTGSLSYKVEGEAPNRKIIIQWKNYSYFYYNNLPSTVPQNAYKLNFQVHLNETGEINFVYDLAKTGTGTPSPASFSTQIGLRGLTNTDYTNRYTTGSSATENLSTTTTGSLNSSVSYVYANFLPASGMTFTWTPPTGCIAPTAQPTNLDLSYEGIIINGTYSPASPAADRYLILRHIDGDTPNIPIDGTIYPVGQNAALNAYVVYYGANTSFQNNYNSGDIRGNNNYIYTIYSVSSNCTGGPFYLTENPLTGSVTNCPGPLNGITAGSQGTNSFVLSWPAGDNGSALEMSRVIEVATDANFTNMVPGSPFTLPASDLTLTVSGLNSNTQYYFRGKNTTQSCESAFSSAGNTRTTCDPYTEAFTESFEGVSGGSYASSTRPECWNFIDGGSGSGYVDLISGNAKTGTKYFYITNSTDATGNYILVSPPTDNFGNGTFRIKFFAKSSTAGQTLILGTLTDGNDASTFTPLQTINLTTSYAEYSLNLPAGTASYFGFKHGLGATYRTIYIDDVVYEPQPACPDVSGLSAGALSDSAILSWSGLGTEYDIEYVTNDLEFTGTPTVTNVANNYQANGLTPNTTYKFRVRQNCTVAGNGLGVWSASLTFKTACASITSFPFTEDFETSSTSIDCWTNEYVTGSANWTYAAGSTSTVTTAQSGARNARFVSVSGTANPVTKLVSPIFDLSALASPKLSFYYAQPAWSSDINHLKVYYRTSPANPWVMLENYNQSVTVWTQVTLDLPNPTATYQIAFEGINNYGRANAIDTVVIYGEDNSACLPTFQYGTDGNMITQVIFNTINKTSPFTSGTTPAYEDFTSETTDVEQGSTHQILVKGPSSTFPSDVMVYIDFNQNGDFSDAGEGFYVGRLQPANPANAFTITSNIDIPADALTGTAKMRIIKNGNVNALSNPDADNSITDPCGSLRAGQVEEYSINILPASVEEDEYCEVTLEEDVEPITLVEYADLLKESPAALGTGDAYENFTHLIANVTRGQSNVLTVKGNTAGPVVNIVRAYIDWNQDGQFDAQTESYTVGMLQGSTGTDAVSVSLPIEVPANAALGTTRMRIVKDADDYNMSACQMIFYGQAEDYTVNVADATSGTGSHKNTVASMYPNPTTGIVNIETPETVKHITVFDITGKQMLVVQNQKSIDLNKYSAGVYFVRVEFENAAIVTSKIVKQ